MAGVQFNLLPSVKLDYLKTLDTRKKVTNVAVLISGVSFALLLIMLTTVQGVQRKQLSDSTAKINSAIKDIESEPGISKVLTVQNQLTSLADLHANKNISSRVFDYLAQVTPTGVNLSRLSVDLTKNTISIDGTADTAANVNKFVDTLKFTKYSLGKDTAQAPAFDSVVETNFNISSTAVSYTLAITYNAVLFSNNAKDSTGSVVVPTLVVPTQTTTRSSIFNEGQ